MKITKLTEYKTLILENKNNDLKEGDIIRFTMLTSLAQREYDHKPLSNMGQITKPGYFEKGLSFKFNHFEPKQTFDNAQVYGVDTEKNLVKIAYSHGSGTYPMFIADFPISFISVFSILDNQPIGTLYDASLIEKDRMEKKEKGEGEDVDTTEDDIKIVG